MELAKWIVFMMVWISANGQDEFANPDTQNYRFNYFVRDENTGDIKSHEEKKLGDTVTGQYTVGEPTGDLRVVSYTADEGGFRANVKYEEGGSPLSDIRDKERQVSPTSGFEFEWLPGNPDDLAAGKTESNDGSNEDTKPSEEENSSEGKVSTENTSESTSTQTEEPSSENSMSDESTPDNLDGKSTQDSKEQMQNDSTSDMMLQETKGESESKSEESDSKEDSMNETTESGEGKEESAEAAESAPGPSQEVAPTETNNLYLPPLPMENLPFYNLPVAQPPAQPSDRPTIIYASQNFYNPWQWFGNAARVQREEPSIEAPEGHYMTGLGYIIVPPKPEN